MKKINKKGFTLVELLAVIVILGVLLLIAVPAVSNIIESSKRKSFESAARLALENVESVASVETTTGASITACDIKLSDIKLERGSFGTGAKGYVSVDASGNATIYYANGTYKIDGKAISPTDTVKAEKDDNTINDKNTTCTWWS